MGGYDPNNSVINNVDPQFTALLEALPVGWEVYASTFAAVIDHQLKGAAPMNEQAAAETTVEPQSLAPTPVDDLAERQAAMVANIVESLTRLVQTETDASILADKDGFTFDMGMGDGVRVLCYHTTIDRYVYRNFAVATAKRLGHTPTEWTYTGDVLIGSVTRCSRCNDLGSISEASQFNGSLFTDFCPKRRDEMLATLHEAPNEHYPQQPGSLANTTPTRSAARRAEIAKAQPYIEY